MRRANSLRIIRIAERVRTVGTMVPEAYQDRILRGVALAIAQGRSGAVMAPTGSGKSLLAAGSCVDAVKLNRPVLILCPNVDLLRQNLAILAACPEVVGPFGLLVAKGERMVSAPHSVRGGFGAWVTLATNASLVNKKANEPVMAQARAFAAAGGVVIVDEGQGAASDELGALLGTLAREGAMGVLLSATPFRTDGRDPLEPFGTTVEESLLGIAHHDEVIASGRTVPTVFELADVEFRRRIGDAAASSIERTYDAMVAGGRSVDEASSSAFAVFFRSNADEARRAIASLVLEAVGGIWHARAHGRRLALIHCDCIPFAHALAFHVSRMTMPTGHPRADMAPRVGYVCGEAATMVMDGRPVDPALAAGLRRRDAREEILRLARAGEVDVLVTVRALGVGTDIPRADLSLIACLRRSLGPFRQNSGRGERAYLTAREAKPDHLLVDLGSSLVTHWTELKAVLASEPEKASKAMLRIPAILLEEFRQWFDGDPALEGKIHERAREKSRRGPRVFGGEVADEETEPTARALPASHPFCEHVTVATQRRRGPSGSVEPPTTAMILDLEGLGLCRPEHGMARYLVGVYARKDGRGAARMTATYRHALAFLQYSGITSKDTAAGPSTKQTYAVARVLKDLSRGTVETPSFARGFVHGESARAVAAFIDATDAMSETVRAMRDHVGTKCFDGRWLAGPARSVLLQGLGEAEPGRLGAFALHRRLSDAFDACTGVVRDRYAVAVTDPSDATTAALAFGVDARDVKVRHPSAGDMDWQHVLRHDVRDARVAGWSARTSADANARDSGWMEASAGLPRDEARAALARRVTDCLERLASVELPFHDMSMRLLRVPRADALDAVSDAACDGSARARTLRLLLDALYGTRECDVQGWQVYRDMKGVEAMRLSLERRTDADPRHVTMALDAAATHRVVARLGNDDLLDLADGVVALVAAHLYDRLDAADDEEGEDVA